MGRKYSELNVYGNNKVSEKILIIMLVMLVFSVMFLMYSYAETLIPNRNLNNFEDHSEYQETVSLDYTWTCEKEKCVKNLVPTNTPRTSLEICKIMCGSPIIWPNPKSIKSNSKELLLLDINNIQFNFNAIDGDKNMALKAADIFLNKVKLLSLNEVKNSGAALQVSLNYSNSVSRLYLKVDESYSVSVDKLSDSLVTAQISGDNFFGVRHGLETLLQLILFDQINQELRVLSGVEITDSPSFSYRGVLVDTARNWFPIEKLKKVVDGMSMSKLNVLHLHLTDSASFPIELPSVMSFAHYGAYSKHMTYSVKDISELIQYGLVRGVRLLLEVDGPSHIDAGWNYRNDFVICQNEEILGGHLNIDNEQVFEILGDIYKDLLVLMGQDDLFHIGGDEVSLNCLKTTKRGKQTKDVLALWANLTNTMLNQLKDVNKNQYPRNVIMWSSPLTETNYLKSFINNVTIQFWLGSPMNILQNGNSIIYSTVENWYLDCGFGSWHSKYEQGVCDPYRPWQKFYKYRPWETFGHHELTLGGEVCLWSEEVDVSTLETRIWPRAAAFSERIWSDPVNYNMLNVGSRLDTFRDRLVTSGIQASALWPRWCYQNPEKC